MSKPPNSEGKHPIFGVANNSLDYGLIHCHPTTNQFMPEWSTKHVKDLRSGPRHIKSNTPHFTVPPNNQSL